MKYLTFTDALTIHPPGQPRPREGTCSREVDLADPNRLGALGYIAGKVIECLRFAHGFQVPPDVVPAGHPRLEVRKTVPGSEVFQYSNQLSAGPLFAVKCPCSAAAFGLRFVAGRVSP